MTNTLAPLPARPELVNILAAACVGCFVLAPEQTTLLQHGFLRNVHDFLRVSGFLFKFTFLHESTIPLSKSKKGCVPGILLVTDEAGNVSKLCVLPAAFSINISCSGHI